MADAELLKTVIRSILTSSPNELTIDDLWRDYKSSEGAEFPFAALGHRSFSEYLKSIPDIVKLEQRPYGPTIVRPVASQKSAHIEKMIMCQKTTTASRLSKKRGGGRKRRAAVVVKSPDKNRGMATHIPSLMDIKNTAPSLSSSRSSSRALTPDTRHSESSGSKSSMNQEMVYNNAGDHAIRRDHMNYDNGDIDPNGSRRVFLKNGIEETVDELVEGIGFLRVNSPPSSQVPRDNKVHGLNVFSRDCSKLWTSGITSPVGPELLYNRIQGVQRCEFGAAEVHSSSSQHKRIVSEMMHRNYEALVITIKVNDESHSYHDSESSNKVIIPDEVVDKLLNLLKNNGEGMRICDIGRRLMLSQKSIDRLCDLNINNVGDILRNLDDYVSVIGDRVFQKLVVSPMPNGVNCVPCRRDYDCDGSGSSQLSGRNSACSGGSNESAINSTLQRNIRAILQENPRGILCDDLPQMYYDKYRSVLDPIDFGFNSVLDMASQLQHQTRGFILKRDINRNAWVLTSFSDKDVHIVQSTDADTPSCSLQAGFVINNFKKLLMKYQPITSGDLLIKYNMTYGRENGIQSLGYKNLEEFINNELRGIVEIIKLKSAQLISLRNDFTCPTALPEDQAINDIMYSKDVCLADEKVPPFEITFSHNLPTKVEFLVSDVTSPDCFSMQLLSSYKVLDKLMTDLYFFYEENEVEYPMCEETITVDALCVCTYAEEDDWHRARIMVVYSETVLLDYIDYGSTCIQPKAKLRLLHKKFATLPVQSIGAKLRGVKPPGNKLQWSDDVKYKLQHMFDSNIIVAEVFSIDSKRSFLDVSLIQVGPEGNETLFSDILVGLGVAEYTDLPDGDSEELDNLQRTVATKRSHRNKVAIDRNTTHSESSNKYSTEDEQNHVTPNKEQMKSSQNSSSTSAGSSFEELLDKTMKQLENTSQNEEPPPKTNCPRPPPGFADINRTQNLLTTGYITGLTTQLQQAGSMMFNLDGVFSDSTPIIPNESVLLCQPLSDCLICRLIYTEKTVSPELLTPLVQHNLRHAQVFYNTLRQNLLLKMNPAAVGMFNMFNSVVGIPNLSPSTLGAQNLNTSPNVLPAYPMPQTVNTVHANSLPSSSAVIPNNVLQSVSNVIVPGSDPTLSVLNNIHVQNSLDTPLIPTDASTASANSRLLEISSDPVSAASDLLCSSNTSLELTGIVGLQSEYIKTIKSRDTRVTPKITTEPSSKIMNSSSMLNPERKNVKLLEINGSGSVSESKSLSNDYAELMTATPTQTVIAVDNVSKVMCVPGSVNERTVTSAFTMHNPESRGVHTPPHIYMSTGVDTIASAEPHLNLVESRSVGSETSVPSSRHMFISSLDSSSQQKSTECMLPANLHANEVLKEMVKTDICTNCGVVISKYDPYTGTESVQQIMCSSSSLPIDKQKYYSDYEDCHDFNPYNLQQKNIVSVPPLSQNTIGRSTGTLKTGVCRKCEIDTKSCQQETSAAPSLPSVLQRKNSFILESSHSSVTRVKSLMEQEVVSESCPDNLNIKTADNNNITYRIPGRSGSKMRFPSSRNYNCE